MTGDSEERNGTIFDGESWKPLVGYIEELPRPVKLVVWASETGGRFEMEALHLAHSLAARFAVVQFEHRDRVPDYPFYPIIGIMGEAEDGSEVDYRVRFIGVPAGYQINGLVGAIQAVSFRASNLEASTRIRLSRLPADASVNVEVFTAAEDEAGSIVATVAAGFAVASPRIQTFIIMADLFPQATVRYSIRTLPHTLVGERIHISGLLDEARLLKQIALALK